MCAFEDKPIETIRMDDREKRQIIESYIARHKNTGGAERDIRLPCDSGETVTVSISNPGGNVVKYTVIPRNLSRWGMAFLHGRFVYQDSPCRIALKTLNQKSITVEGKIVRCSHLGSTIHEVGVLFSSPIDLGQFLSLTAEEQATQAEEMERDKLNGRIPAGSSEHSGGVLIVDESKLDRRLCETYLTQDGFTCHGISDEQEAVKRAQAEGFELAVIDVSSNPVYGFTLIKALTQTPGAGVILAVSVEDDEATKDAAIEAGAHAFMAKPLSPEKLLTHARELIVTGSSNVVSESNAILSTMSHDPSMQPLLREFVGEAMELASSLKAAQAGNDGDTARKACRQLKSSGKGYGYDVVTELAQGVLSSLDTSNDDLAKCKDTIDELLDVIHRISPG